MYSFPLLFLFLLLAFLIPPFLLFMATRFIPFSIVEFGPFVPQPFLAPDGHPSRTTHLPAGCPPITSTQSMLVAPLSISRQNYLPCFLPFSVLVLPIWIRIKLPHHVPLWHASSDFSPYLPILGEIPSQQDISPKEVWVETLEWTPFSPRYQTTPFLNT